MENWSFTKMLCAFGALLFFAGMQHVAAQSPNPPVTLPTAPSHSESEVLSIYSDAYTVNPAAEFVFTGSSATEVEISGDPVKYVKIGTESGGTAYGSAVFTFNAPVDISGYKVLFMDVYAVEANTFNLRVGFNTQNTTEKTISYRVATGWNKLEIELNDYKILSPSPDFSQMTEIRLTGEGARNLYIDNIYACTATPTDLLNAPTVSAPIPTRKISDVLPIFTDTYSNEIGASIDVSTGGTTKKFKVLDFNSNLDKMIYVVGGSSGNGGLNFNSAIDVSEYDSLHFDVYINSANLTLTTPLRIVIGGFATKSSPAVASANVVNGWNSIDVSLEDLAASALANNSASIVDYTNLKNKAFWLFAANGGSRTFFLDNVYFYKKASTNTDIKNAAPETKINVYLNSVSGNLSVTSGKIIDVVYVYDITGKNIKTVQVNAGNVEIDMQDQASGFYVLTVVSEDGSVFTEKIVKK